MTLNGEIKQALAFLWRLRRMVLGVAVAFFAAGIAGHFIFLAVYRSDPAQMQAHMQQLTQMFESKDIMDESGQLSALGLFFNNFIAAGMSVVLGVVPFLFISVFTLVLNAALLGMMSAMLSEAATGGFYTLVVSVVPHGIVELPALFICTAMGLVLCRDISARILYRKREMSFLALLGEMARLMALLVVPMLIVAALIEAYLTPVIMYWLL